MKALRICLVSPVSPCDGAGWGGIHSHTRALLSLLARDGHETVLLTPARPACSLPPGCRAEIIRADAGRFPGREWDGAIEAAFLAAEGGRRFDFVFSEGYWALGLERLSGKAPILAFTHNFHFVHFRTNYLEIEGLRSLASYLLRTCPRLFYRMLFLEIPFLRRAAGVIPASEHHGELLKRFYLLPGEKVSPLRNWVDSGEFRPASPEEKAAARLRLNLAPGDMVFLTMGSLWRPKGFHVAIEAFRRLARERADAVLLLGGAGQAEAGLRALAGDLCASGRVRFPGAVGRDGLPDFLRAADVFLLPSLFPEVLSYSLLEAMSSGLPAVVTDAGGNTEAAGDAALVVPPGDVEALKHAAARLAGDPALRETLGAAARARVEKLFSEEPALRALRKILEKPA